MIDAFILGGLAYAATILISYFALKAIDRINYKRNKLKYSAYGKITKKITAGFNSHTYECEYRDQSGNIVGVTEWGLFKSGYPMNDSNAKYFNIDGEIE